MKVQSALILLAIATSPSIAGAQSASARPELVSKMTDCRKIPDNMARLACFDRQVALFEEAEQKRDVVVVDREEIRRTKRSFFGLTLPEMKLFGDRDAGGADFTTIETTIASAQQTGGAWLFTLEDGARWVQSDSAELARTPKAGQAIRIRRAAMGSYLANIGSGVAIRVRRIN